MSGALTEQAWMLKNKVNPFPVAGTLALDNGRISFTMGQLAADAALGWVEEALGQTGRGERLKAGEETPVFDYALGDAAISWPKMYAGSVVQVTDATQDRSWIVSMDYPSGGSISQTMSLFSGRKKGKVWKKALSDSS